jgi:cell division protein FtsI (penicillin-binding protein 3)
VLATSLATYSLYGDPARVFDAADAAAKIAGVLPDLDRAEALAALTSDRRFVWLRRHLTPRQYYDINRLGIPGLSFRPEERRVYPHGALVSHVLGFTDIDNAGIAGAEKAAMTEFRAAGASAIILNVRNGELLGMVSLPDFDPNERSSAAPEAMFNRNTLGVYEMGSTFKIFTVAAALETGVATLNDSYDVRRPIRIARFVINDYKPRNRALTVPEIFIYSSNIGSAKLALDIGTARQQDFLARLGLLRPAQIELPEVGAPMRPTPWREINTMTIAYGHGIAVSPLQLASAVAGIVNDGMQSRTTIRRRPEGTAAPGRRVVTAQTSRAMRSLMREVVKRGTGRRANAEGYQVGGKTGSADKYRNRQGKRGLLSSFVGVFPVSAPRYVVLVILDEPRGTKATHNRATGGWVAAPATGRIVSRVAPMLGVRPVDEHLIARRRPAPVVTVSSGVRKGAAF